MSHFLNEQVMDRKIVITFTLVLLFTGFANAPTANSGLDLRGITGVELPAVADPLTQAGRQG
jgi:hypothetical protein